MTNRRLQAATGLSDREYQDRVNKLSQIAAAESRRTDEADADD